ncbi:MAG: hypothetical protein IK990_07610 [Ruminiclostridium sp.]|nr:hypothetical protein [Ruminiclostridium sp.]
MNKIFEDMKKQAVPDEQTVSLLLERLPEKRRKRCARPLIAALAVTAAAFSMTAAVGAATNWTFTFLDDPAAGFDDNTAAHSIVNSAAYSNSVSQFGFELVGAAADNGILRAIIDIFPPDGTEFDDTNTPVLYRDIAFFVRVTDPGSPHGLGGSDCIIFSSPQKIRVMSQSDSTLSLENRDIEISANVPVYDENGRITEHRKIWVANITTGSSGEKLSYSRLVLPEGKLRTSGGYVIPFRAEVGCMTIKLFGLFSEQVMQNEDVFAKMADGSLMQMKWSGAGGYLHDGYTDGSMTFTFPDIVQPCDVRSVVINGSEIIFPEN